MDLGSTQLYNFELWTSAGIRVADISKFCKNRTYTLERNEAEILSFDLDLFDIEAFFTSISVDPKAAFMPYAADIKVKRNGVYLFGTQIVDVIFDSAADFSRANEAGTGGRQTSLDQKVTVQCTGYLNLFKDRYLTYTYSQQDACFIAGDMLTQVQAVTNGNMGVTLGSSSYLTGVLRDRTYSRQNIKTELQNLTQLIDGRFDFGFDANKVFTPYSQIGSKRSDIAFVYGGPQSNVIGLYMERSGANLFNDIVDLGSGFGPDQLVSEQGDTASQQSYYLRTAIKQDNSVVLQPTLDQNAKVYLALEKDMLEIPQITITGKELANLTSFLSPGDRIPISTTAHPLLNLNGIYRIERMVVMIDDNDFESSIELYFDTYAVNTST